MEWGGELPIFLVISIECSMMVHHVRVRLDIIINEQPPPRFPAFSRFLSNHHFVSTNRGISHSDETRVSYAPSPASAISCPSLDMICIDDLVDLLYIPSFQGFFF